MIEGFADQLPEDLMADAIMFGPQSDRRNCDMQLDSLKQGGKPKVELKAAVKNPFLDQVKSEAYQSLCDARFNPKKKERSAAAHAVKQSLVEKYFPDGIAELADGRTFTS